MNTMTCIGDLFPQILIGGTPPRGNRRFFDGEHVWVSIRDMEGKNVITESLEHLTDEGLAHSNCKLVRKGSLLFSFKLTVGRVAIAGVDLYTNEAIAAFDIEAACLAGIDLNYMALVLPAIAQADPTKNSMGAALLNKERISGLKIPLPNIDVQRCIAAHLKIQLTAIEEARQAAKDQTTELTQLAHAIIRETLNHPDTKTHLLGDVLDEVKRGVGASWADYPVLGATRNGLAPAREPVGKSPERYKPVFNGTVFYNPMRILIGSIAMVDEHDTPGITSPDYVALRGRVGLVDSRWFYYWLRSPEGERCIASLARGAVRERMLFNRLAEGEITLPPYEVQVKASQALADIRPLKTHVEAQLRDIELLPSRLLAQVFDTQGDTKNDE